jgi:hypothetical protein
MELICTEEIISSLLIIGFESVDSLLYTYTLGELTINREAKHNFKYVDAGLSDEFSRYISYDGMKFQLKDGLELGTEVKVEGLDRPLPLIRRLRANKELVKYLNDLDFSEIISKKLGDIEDENLKKILVCPYEKRIMSSNGAPIKQKRRKEVCSI